MRKIAASAVLFLFALLAACSTGQVEKAPAGSAEAITSAPADSYIAYYEAKGEALDRLLAETEANEELYMLIYESLAPLTEADMALMPIKAIGRQESGSEMEKLGITGVNIEQNDGNIRVSGSRGGDKDGAFELVCAYDAAADSMQAAVSDDGGEALSLEYARADSGYVSQYYIKGSSASIRLHIGGDAFTVGIDTAQEKPGTIPPGAGADFAEHGEMYIKLVGGRLTVFTGGEEKTY